MAANEAAMQDEWAKPETEAKRTVMAYYASRAFTEDLAPLTQQNRKAILQALPQ